MTKIQTCTLRFDKKTASGLRILSARSLDLKNQTETVIWTPKPSSDLQEDSVCKKKFQQF